MVQNEIIAEIHRHREQLVRSCGCDVKKLMNHYRQRETQRVDAGHKIVSYAKAASTDENSCVLREEPPKTRGD